MINLAGQRNIITLWSHPKFGQVRLPTNAATNADFLNHIGQHVKPPLTGLMDI